MKALSAALAAALLLTAPAAAHEVKKGDVTVEHPLLRASLGKVPNTAGYFTVRNAGRTPDRLLGGACACAARVELHTHVTHAGVSRMRKTEAVAVPAAGEARFAPGAHHLMLFGLKRPLEAGTVVPVVLRFERAGPVTVPFFVTARVDQELNAHRPGHAH